MLLGLSLPNSAMILILFVDSWLLSVYILLADAGTVLYSLSSHYNVARTTTTTTTFALHAADSMKLAISCLRPEI